MSDVPRGIQRLFWKGFSMGYFKHQRKIDGRHGRKEMRCSECGTVIEQGEFYYSRITKQPHKQQKSNPFILCYKVITEFPFFDNLQNMRIYYLFQLIEFAFCKLDDFISI